MASQSLSHFTVTLAKRVNGPEQILTHMLADYKTLGKSTLLWFSIQKIKRLLPLHTHYVI